MLFPGATQHTSCFLAEGLLDPISSTGSRDRELLARALSRLSSKLPAKFVTSLFLLYGTDFFQPFTYLTVNSLRIFRHLKTSALLAIKLISERQQDGMF